MSSRPMSPQMKLHLRNVNLRKIERKLAHLTTEERVARNRLAAANAMFRVPGIAVYPERWIADLFGGNGGAG